MACSSTLCLLLLLQIILLFCTAYRPLQTPPHPQFLNTASDIFLYFHYPQGLSSKHDLRYLSIFPPPSKVAEISRYVSVSPFPNASVLNTASHTFLYCHLFSYSICLIYFPKLNGVCTYHFAFSIHISVQSCLEVCRVHRLWSSAGLFHRMEL